MVLCWHWLHQLSYRGRSRISQGGAKLGESICKLRKVATGTTGVASTCSVRSTLTCMLFPEGSET